MFTWMEVWSSMDQNVQKRMDQVCMTNYAVRARKDSHTPVLATVAAGIRRLCTLMISLRMVFSHSRKWMWTWAFADLGLSKVPL